MLIEVELRLGNNCKLYSLWSDIKIYVVWRKRIFEEKAWHDLANVKQINFIYIIVILEM